MLDTGFSRAGKRANFRSAAVRMEIVQAKNSTFAVETLVGEYNGSEIFTVRLVQMF